MRQSVFIIILAESELKIMLKNFLYVFLCTILLVSAVSCSGNNDPAISDGQNIENESENSDTISDVPCCPLCGNDTLELEGNNFEITIYDDYGNKIKYYLADAEGNALENTEWKYEYDDNGNIMREETYYDGKLYYVSEYAKDEDGEIYHVKSSDYQDDGSYYVYEYTNQGNSENTFGYDAEGNLTYESYSEFLYDSNGYQYESKTTVNYIDIGEKYVYEYDEHNNLLSRSCTLADGTVQYEYTYEREYNDEGRIVWEKTYNFGIITQEIVSYTIQEDNNGWIRYPDKIIEYYEDGSKLVSEYGYNGELVKETYYNSDDTIARELTYTIEYDDNGNYIGKKSYDGDRLISETQYSYDSEGWTYVSHITEYSEDGSYIIYDYDESGSIIKTTSYDSENNVISEK